MQNLNFLAHVVQKLQSEKTQVDRDTERQIDKDTHWQAHITENVTCQW